VNERHPAIRYASPPGEIFNVFFLALVGVFVGVIGVVFVVSSDGSTIGDPTADIGRSGVARLLDRAPDSVVGLVVIGIGILFLAAGVRAIPYKLGRRPVLEFVETPEGLDLVKPGMFWGSRTACSIPRGAHLELSVRLGFAYDNGLARSRVVNLEHDGTTLFRFSVSRHMGEGLFRYVSFAPLRDAVVSQAGTLVASDPSLADELFSWPDDESA